MWTKPHGMCHLHFGNGLRNSNRNVADYLMGLAHTIGPRRTIYVTVFHCMYPRFNCIHLQCVWLVHLPKNYKVFTALIIWPWSSCYIQYILYSSCREAFLWRKRKRPCATFFGPLGHLRKRVVAGPFTYIHTYTQQKNLWSCQVCQPKVGRYYSTSRYMVHMY